MQMNAKHVKRLALALRQKMPVRTYETIETNKGWLSAVEAVRFTAIPTGFLDDFDELSGYFSTKNWLARQPAG